MMRCHATRTLAHWNAALLMFIGPALYAQNDAGTLKDIVADVAHAAQLSKFDLVDPPDAQILESVLGRLSISHAADYSFDQLASVIASKDGPSFSAVARWNPDTYDARVEPTFVADITTMRGIANNQLADAIEQTLGRAERIRLLARVNSLHKAILATAKEQNLDKLRRYEIKYGPKSPRLNGPEVLLNYAAQAIPGFGPTSDGWPGPLELIATYSTTELTLLRNSDDKLRAHVVSASHFGVRHYQFGKGWGNSGGLTGILKPAHFSAGATLMGPSDQALGNPFKRGRRYGGFVSWGDVLVGFVGGAHRRVLLSRNLKVIPYVF